MLRTGPVSPRPQKVPGRIGDSPLRTSGHFKKLCVIITSSSKNQPLGLQELLSFEEDVRPASVALQTKKLQATARPWFPALVTH